MGFIDSLKKLFSGEGKNEEQTSEQTRESETNTPEQSGCGHCDSSEGHHEGHEETKRESDAPEEHSK